jgi:hypothetical protein
VQSKPTVRVADFTNPDLKPWANATMRRANENALAGIAGPRFAPLTWVPPRIHAVAPTIRVVPHPATSSTPICEGPTAAAAAKLGIVGTSTTNGANTLRV